MSDRVIFAQEAGLELPEGRIALFDPPISSSLPTGNIEVITSHRPDFDIWQERGRAVRTELCGHYTGVIVTLGRARARNEARLAQAAKAAPDGMIVVNGAKTDGIDSLLKALKSRVPLLGQVSKAHGKCAWFSSGPELQDFAKPLMQQIADGYWTAPGVFSADGPDPGSAALARALPKLHGKIADLGAGWGWLSSEILQQSNVSELCLIEADHTALDCARRNITDTRAGFHWADALRWKPSQRLDVVVMNPPFHSGRKADASLGQGFIKAAARMLGPRGQVYLVANRHLPYEQTLAECFRTSQEIGGTSAFKLLHAMTPRHE